MASTFSTAKFGLDDIARRIQSNRVRLQNVKDTAANASNELDNMATQHGQLIADINAAAAANPNNQALQLLKSEKDLLVAEFNALLAKAEQFETAVSGITF